MLRDSEKALARKVIAGFEATEQKQWELMRREGPRRRWAVEISKELFEVACKAPGKRPSRKPAKRRGAAAKPVSRGGTSSRQERALADVTRVLETLGTPPAVVMTMTALDVMFPVA